MTGLNQVREDMSHLPLLRNYVALQVAIERQEKQAVRARHPGDEVHYEQLHLLASTENEWDLISGRGQPACEGETSQNRTIVVI